MLELHDMLVDSAATALMWGLCAALGWHAPPHRVGVINQCLSPSVKDAAMAFIHCARGKYVAWLSR